ncbi:MAG: OmpA family protein [Deltaproteobacteria bacterium]|nr:OmpA family protein [Deltaproteobacteria bacterium]
MKKISVLVLCMSMMGLSSCASKAGKGAGIGAGAGAAVGAGIGAIVGGKQGAIIGAGAGAMTGAVTGGMIGAKMDKQEEELKKIEAAEVERVAENKINVKFDSGILFDTGSANLKSDATTALTNFADVLKQYPENQLTIEGHTDSTGSKTLNQQLSEQRAASVKSLLQGKGVDSTRMVTMGYADSKPVASNAEAQGRAKNRRVEIIIVQEPTVQETAQ